MHLHPIKLIQNMNREASGRKHKMIDINRLFLFFYSIRCAPSFTTIISMQYRIMELSSIPNNIILEDRKNITEGIYYREIVYSIHQEQYLWNTDYMRTRLYTSLNLEFIACHFITNTPKLMEHNTRTSNFYVNF
ncbi:hypothetical protein ACJX0J_040829 [Zea mays]